jgi:hypothetical protein
MSPPLNATLHHWCCGERAEAPLTDSGLELISEHSHLVTPVSQTCPCGLGTVEVCLIEQSET